VTDPVTAPPASPWKAAFSSRSFLLAVGVLVVAAVGLNTAARALEMYFKKLPVPLRHRLDDATAGVPKQLGSWVSVQQTSSLDEDVQHTLGTRDFVFRTYVNTRVAGEDVVKRLVELGEEAEKYDESVESEAREKKLKMVEWHAALRRVQAANPEAVISLNVTFYTGMVDTVAHVPDRCMVADGYEPKDTRSEKVVAGAYPDSTPREVEMRVATFEDQTGHGRVARNVAYFFHCNGEYTPNAVDVRGKLQNLFEKYGYYAKVEMMTDDPGRQRDPGDQDAKTSKSIEAMADLLASALPEVERCLPDWHAVKGTGPAAAEPKPADTVAAK
jgi:hypothetical protein